MDELDRPRDEQRPFESLSCLKIGLEGVALVIVAMVGLMSVLSSLPGAELGLFQQLNQELGALCQEPPAKAMKVCDLHARLVHR